MNDKKITHTYKNEISYEVNLTSVTNTYPQIEPRP